MARKSARGRAAVAAPEGRTSTVRKEATVTFRVDDDQQAALEKAARKEGDSLGNWCRRNLLKLAGWQYEGNGDSA